MGQEQLCIIQEMKRGEDGTRIKQKISWGEEGNMSSNREVCKRTRGQQGKTYERSAFYLTACALGADCFHAVRPWHLELQFNRT